MNNIYLVQLIAITSHTRSAIFLGGKMLLSLRQQLHCRLNLKPLVYSFLALIISGWKYFYSAFCTQRFWHSKSITNICPRERQPLSLSSKIHDGREMLAAEIPPYSQKISPLCHHERNNALIFLKCLFLFQFRKEI